MSFFRQYSVSRSVLPPLVSKNSAHKRRFEIKTQKTTNRKNQTSSLNRAGSYRKRRTLPRRHYAGISHIRFKADADAGNEGFYHISLFPLKTY